MSSIEQTSFKRGVKVYIHVRSVSRIEARHNPTVSERNLLTDLARNGFSMVWDHMDIAYHQTTELWANITTNTRGKWKAEKEVMRLDICYGSLKLSIAGLVDTISWELVADFAATMLVLSRNVVFGAFRLIFLANWAALVITLAIAAGAAQVFGTLKPQQLVTGP